MKVKYFFVPSGVGATVVQDYIVDHPSNLIILDFDQLFNLDLPIYAEMSEKILIHIKKSIDESVEFINNAREVGDKPDVDTVHVVKTYTDIDWVNRTNLYLIKEGYETHICDSSVDILASQREIISIITNGTVTFEQALEHRKHVMGDNATCEEERIAAGHLETSGPSHVVLTEEEQIAQNNTVQRIITEIEVK